MVFEDADLDRALDAVIFMIYSLNGERCTSSSRLLVQDSIADAFEAKLIDRVNRIKVGHPMDPATEIGPLIYHFNMFASDVDASMAFYSDFGFRVTEYIQDAHTGRTWAAWMHRKGGVHDVALTNGTGPRLPQTAFWVPTPLNIIDPAPPPKPFSAPVLLGCRTLGQGPARADEMACIAMGDPLQIILMLGLCLPEITGGLDLGHHLARPQV